MGGLDIDNECICKTIISYLEMPIECCFRRHVTRKRSVLLLWCFIFLGVGFYLEVESNALLPIHDNGHIKSTEIQYTQSEMKAIASHSPLSMRQYHQRHMCFVHLGKTGGSSITCSLPQKFRNLELEGLVVPSKTMPTKAILVRLLHKPSLTEFIFSQHRLGILGLIPSWLQYEIH